MIINGIEYKGRGGTTYREMPKRDGWVILNLLEIYTGKKRRTIQTEFSKMKYKLNDYERVKEYILSFKHK